MTKFFRRAWTIFAVLALLLQAVAAVNTTENTFYGDVPQSRWSYPSVRTLYDAGILPHSELLKPEQAETRGNFVVYLHSLALALGRTVQSGGVLPFTDISPDDAGYPAYVWAYSNNIIKGVDASSFAPQETISRQDVCVILVRFAGHLGLLLPKQAEYCQFKDSFRISGYARTPVAASQMMGLIQGYQNGFFKPFGQITREECAAMICRLYDSARKPLPTGSECVLTGERVYDDLYTNVTAYSTTLPQGSEVEKSHFDDAVFVGDSVSVMLQYYCTSTKALGEAKFLCAGSLSATNALAPVTQASVHPSFQGIKVKVEDGVAASGANKVYIMLGINNISFGLDKSTGDMVELIEGILEKSPEVSIYIQSVTPMSKASNILSQGLNNEKIRQYNLRMEEICAERGWYFVNVAEAFCDSEGYLPAEYCSDYSGMGIHFTNAAAQHWIAYLKTHANVTE